MSETTQPENLFGTVMLDGLPVQCNCGGSMFLCRKHANAYRHLPSATQSQKGGDESCLPPYGENQSTTVGGNAEAGSNPLSSATPAPPQSVVEGTAAPRTTALVDRLKWQFSGDTIKALYEIADLSASLEREAATSRAESERLKAERDEARAKMTAAVNSVVESAEQVGAMKRELAEVRNLMNDDNQIILIQTLSDQRDRLSAEAQALREERDKWQGECRIMQIKLNNSLANNLCPDHRDKQQGKPCLACEIETLTRKTADLAALREERQWQSIETAPKCDGEGRHPVLVTFSPHTGHHAPIAVARLTRNGWISGKRYCQLWFQPTHWQPLPQPPAAERLKGQETK